MDPFTASFLAGLSSTLTSQVLNGVTSRLSKSIIGTEKERALKRCLNSGVVAIATTVSTDLKKRGRKASRENLQVLF